jgi:hypothetical protein
MVRSTPPFTSTGALQLELFSYLWPLFMEALADPLPLALQDASVCFQRRHDVLPERSCKGSGNARPVSSKIGEVSADVPLDPPLKLGLVHEPIMPWRSAPGAHSGTYRVVGLRTDAIAVTGW